MADDQALTPEEMAKAMALQDPDAGGPSLSDTYEKWDEDYQRELVSMLLHDRSFLIESLPLIQPVYFSNEIHSTIIAILFAHFDRYKVLPTRSQMVMELRDRLSNRKEEQVSRYLAEYALVTTYFLPGVNTRDHYRDKVVNFAKMQATKAAVRKTLEQIKKNPEAEETWVMIQQFWKEASTIDRSFSMGLEYFQTVEERYARKKERQEKGEIFTSGFKAIDDGLKNGGLLRGEIGSWMAMSGAGKSLALITAAIANMHLGKKVLYVTLEIDQDAVAERFDSQMANYRGPKGVTVNNLLSKEDVVVAELKDYVADKEDPRVLVIKQFPSGQLDVPTFRAYFQQISLHGFRPDLVIIDYVGEMKDYPNMPKHESRYQVVRDLRGFAVEEQVCVLTAMQPNKSGKEVVRNGMLMDDENIGDAFAQVRPLDALWTINQLLDERECGVARVNVAKHRDGKSRYAFPIKFDYETLSITQISQTTYEATIKKYRMEKDVDTSDILKQELQQKKLEQIMEGRKKEKGEPVMKGFRGDAGRQEAEPLAPDLTPELT